MAGLNVREHAAVTRDDAATIFALSTGGLPSAIAVIRLSGPRAGEAVRALAGKLPPARTARLALLRDGAGEAIDRGLCLWFPGPASMTGEDMAEFHIHGSRAGAARMLGVLGAMPGLRAAEAGEFARRAFHNSKIDLSEAEGLADLIAAETESQRRHALAIAEGGLAARVAAWREALIDARARIEAILNFADEGDVEDAGEQAARDAAARIAGEIGEALASPPAERLRDGVRVAIAGPPNAGKSTLLNALAGREAAIVSDIAGTTRDVIEAPVVIDGIGFLLSDTAGLRDGDDPIEREGMRRATAAIDQADIVLWLGDVENAPHQSYTVHSKADQPARGDAPPRAVVAVSPLTGLGMAKLRAWLIDHARTMLPRDDQLALNARQRAALAAALNRLGAPPFDAVMLAENLRGATGELDAVLGRAGVEDMLDALFGQFCIGK